MTPIPRRRSFSRAVYWLCLWLITSLLFIFSPFGPFPQHASRFTLFVAPLSFPLVLAAFGWLGPVWGLGTVSWLMATVGLAGLTERNIFLTLFPLALALFAVAAHRGIVRWKTVQQENQLRVNRGLEEENTRSDRIRHLEQMLEAGRERLLRYQGLRGFANRLNLTLPMEELLTATSGSIVEQIHSAERVLLYLVNPEGLHLELRKVWRRFGSEMIQAKRGDPYDHWVMRQSQPLSVEEVGRDFRFPEKTSALDDRPLGSLLVVPLKSEHRFLGVLRVESIRPGVLGSDELRLMGIVADLASLAVENSLLFGRTAELANTDDLTGLAVKRFFLERLEEAMARAGKEGGTFSVLLVDIDHFKGYNDTFGHSAGDKLLRKTGQMLRRLMRPEDLAARFGGEEFICLVMGRPELGIQRAGEICARVEATPVELRRSLARATVSIGVAAYPQDGEEGSSLLRVADRRLYRAKAGGRNRVCGEG